MPHIAVTMLPGRDRETKQKLAENLCNTLIETLGVDAKFVSVSVEDVEMKEWENSMQRIPAETIIVNPNKNEYEKLLLIPLLLLTVLSMAACGGGDDEPFRPGQPETPEQPGEKEDGRTAALPVRRPEPLLHGKENSEDCHGLKCLYPIPA